MPQIRVLHVVVSMDAGGIETMLMNYYRNMDRSKVQFDFLLHCKHKSFFEDEIEALGGRIYRVPSYHPKYQIKYRAALNRFFREHNEYKVVHSHIGFYSMYVLRTAKRHGVPVRIAHSHSSNKFWRLGVSLPFRIVTRHGLKRQYTHVYACSPEAAEYMAPGKEYTVMNNAIDVKSFTFDSAVQKEIRDKLNIKDELVLGHVGRFVEPKNHTFLLDVFAEVVKLCPNAKLLLVGGGALLDGIKGKAKALKIEDKVIFAGVRKDIAALMSAMDIFVFPSKFEGFPVALVEAQSADLPCVISNTFSKTAIVSERVEILSLNDAPKAWAEQILKTNKALPRKDNTEMMINAGLDIKSNAEHLQNVYLEAYGYGKE